MTKLFCDECQNLAWSDYDTRRRMINILNLPCIWIKKTYVCQNCGEAFKEEIKGLK